MIGYIGLLLFAIGSVLVLISIATYGGGLIFIGVLLLPFALAAIVAAIGRLLELPNKIKEKRRSEQQNNAASGKQSTSNQARANPAGEMILQKRMAIETLMDGGRLDEEDAKRVVEFVMAHPNGCSLGAIHLELLDHKDLILKRYGIPGAVSRYPFILSVYQSAGLLTEQQMIQYRDSFTREVTEQMARAKQ